MELKEHNIKRIVVGYTIDAVIEAHNIAMNPENDVSFYSTGKLGEPLDKYNDYVSLDDAKRLTAILPELEFEEVPDCEYMYIPYDDITFKTSKNGLIQFPLSKISFDDMDEWKAASDGYHDGKMQEILQNKGNSPTRLISMYKQCMPKWFVDSIVRNTSNTRWSGISTSELTLNGYLYEFNLNKIDFDGVEKWYRPTISYNEICQKILNDNNISVHQADKDECYDILTNRRREYVTFMDNRVDYYLGYRNGMFDRCIMNSVPVTEYPDYVSELDDGFVRTPKSDYWGISKHGCDVRKLYSERIKAISDIPMSEIPMTKNNLRVYDAYSRILPLYGKFKNLNLQQKITTLIK